MKKYEITEEQKNQIVKILGEVPAKFSIDIINFFNSLKAIETKEEPKEAE